MSAPLPVHDYSVARFEGQMGNSRQKPPAALTCPFELPCTTYATVGSEYWLVRLNLPRAILNPGLFYPRTCLDTILALLSLPKSKPQPRSLTTYTE
jgi:hypothetical protein